MKILLRFFTGLLLASIICGFIWSQRSSTAAQRETAVTAARATRGLHRTNASVPSRIPAFAGVPDLKVALGEQESARDWREFAPEHLTVQLTPELALPFRVTKMRHDADGRTVLRARIDKAAAEKSGMDSAFLVSTTRSADRWDAIVVLPGDQEYHVTVKNGLSAVTSISTQFKCVAEAEADMVTPNQRYASLNMAAAPTSAPTVVNVLFVAADCSNYIEAGNAILENSLVTNFTWNYLGVVNAPTFTSTGTMAGDIAEMTAPLTVGSFSTFISNTEYANGADQIVLLDGVPSVPGGAGGIASVPGTNLTTGDIVITAAGDNCSAVWYPVGDSTQTTLSYPITQYSEPAVVVIHELGHNFGCLHDRVTMGATPGDGKYNYGFCFADATAGTGGPTVGDQSGTVMSYGGLIVPYYSNPNATYHGYSLGVPIGQPLAADNAAVMANNAAAMSAKHLAYSDPVITAQPQGATVTIGQAINLSASASGGGLTYQWFKNSSAITGATSSTYYLSSAASGDAGDYMMTATNPAGSISTNSATVTVSSGPSGGGTSSSSGGGGGGAPSEWFLGALVLLALARRTQRREWTA
jgi:MYXO-CTERM domain-containing protein